MYSSLTRVFNVRKVDSTEFSLSLFRCLANTPNPPCDTPCLAIVSDLRTSIIETEICTKLHHMQGNIKTWNEHIYKHATDIFTLIIRCADFSFLFL